MLNRVVCLNRSCSDVLDTWTKVNKIGWKKELEGSEAWTDETCQARQFRYNWTTKFRKLWEKRILSRLPLFQLRYRTISARNRYCWNLYRSPPPLRSIVFCFEICPCQTDFARHNTREMLSLGNTRFEFLTCTFFTYLFIFFSFEVWRKIQIPTVDWGLVDWVRKREKERKK